MPSPLRFIRPPTPTSLMPSDSFSRARSSKPQPDSCPLEQQLQDRIGRLLPLMRTNPSAVAAVLEMVDWALRVHGA